MRPEEVPAEVLGDAGRVELEWRIRLMHGGAVAEVINRGHRALDELDPRR